MRFLYKTGSTVTDYTSDVKEYSSGNVSLTVGTSDAIYIGQRHPFNHLFFKMKVKNATAATATVKIWDGDEFISVAEITDETSLGGKTLGKSGFLEWVPDKDLSGWAREDSDDMDSDLNSVKIYDQFWIKLTFSASITFSVRWIGNLFLNDADLYAEYPIFNRSNIKTAFNVSDWEEQRVRASEVMIQDMIARQIIDFSGQILDKDQPRLASVHKTAEIIFAAMGDDYEKDRVKAKNEYENRMGAGIYNIDMNQNASLDVTEEKNRTGFLSR